MHLHAFHNVFHECVGCLFICDVANLWIYIYIFLLNRIIGRVSESGRLPGSWRMVRLRRWSASMRSPLIGWHMMSTTASLIKNKRSRNKNVGEVHWDAQVVVQQRLQTNRQKIVAHRIQVQLSRRSLHRLMARQLSRCSLTRARRRSLNEWVQQHRGFQWHVLAQAKHALNGIIVHKYCDSTYIYRERERFNTPL